MSCLQLWALHHSGPPPQHLDPRTHLDQLHREQNTSVSNSNTQEAALHNTEVSKTCKTSCTACVVIITTHTHTQNTGKHKSKPSN